MNATKLAAAAVAAVSVMGAITLAYAQVTSPAASASSPGMQEPMAPSTQTMPTDSTVPNGRATSGTMNAPSSGSTRDAATRPARETLSSDGSTMREERAARADRN